MKKVFYLLSLLFVLGACNKESQIEVPEVDLEQDEKISEKTIEEKPKIPAEDSEEKREEKLEEKLQEEISKKYPNIKSKTDYNNNGKDDYSDFIDGAREDARNHPKYDSAYVGINNGYPDPKSGVCTDVIWRAMKQAGYSMRSMLNADIARRRQAYTNISASPDPKIDFRRVKTLRPFYEKYCLKLETDLNDPNKWQPGDIIIFGPRDFHIGILSDKRNQEGFPFVFHNMGQTEREEDFLKRYPITGHYRFVAKDIPKNVLKPWVDGEDGNQ